MSYTNPDRLQAFILAHSIEARLLRDLGPTPTVAAAAQALGVHPDQIVKTLFFEIEAVPNREDPASTEDQRVVVISHGERRIDKRALAAAFQVGRKRVKLASPAVVLEQLGFAAGGVPPFGHRKPHPVLLDASLLHFVDTQPPKHSATQPRQRQMLYAGGGDDQTMLEISLAELLRVTAPQVLPLSESPSAEPPSAVPPSAGPPNN